MSLTSSGCFLILNRMAPPHGICVEHVEVITRNNLLERFASAIITTEEVDFITDQISSVASEAFGWTSEYLRLGPGESFGIEHMQILEVLVA